MDLAADCAAGVEQGLEWAEARDAVFGRPDQVCDVELGEGREDSVDLEADVVV